MGKRGVKAKDPSSTAAALRTGIPKMPPEIKDNEIAAREWNRITRIARKKKFLTTFDKGVLAAYCLAYSEMLEAGKAISDAADLSFKTPKGSKQQLPEVGIMHTAMGKLLSFSKELGFSPNSRGRIRLADEPEDDDVPGLD